MDRIFEKLARQVTQWTGSTLATVLAFLVIIVWTAGGFVFGFGTDYQMYINTGTTIVTFLMVFLIQRGQNKESLAIQLKLNEIVAAAQGASNRLINVEDLSEKEIHTLKNHYQLLVELAGKEQHLTESHSVEEAQSRHALKAQGGKKPMR